MVRIVTHHQHLSYFSSFPGVISILFNISQTIKGDMEEEEEEEGDAIPKLLDLIPNDRSWVVATDYGVRVQEEEEKLELRLGPPVDSLGCYYSKSKGKASKRGFSDTVHDGHNREGFLPPPRAANGGPEQQQQQQQGLLERKACCPLPPAHAASGNATGRNNSTFQTRSTSVPVVGWPPVRTFRKNIASTSTKPSVVQQDNRTVETSAAATENCKKGLFVKINMDGIPIGRKVDLKAYHSYEKLSSAVEELFRGLLAAQKVPIAGGGQISDEGEKAFTRLLDGSGEYTLVYEDNEGDKMLVGDVPWDMFVSTAKRLRVLKSSELSALSLGATSRKRTAMPN